MGYISALTYYLLLLRTDGRTLDRYIGAYGVGSVDN